MLRQPNHKPARESRMKWRQQRGHQPVGGFPADAIHEVKTIIDPTTAEQGTPRIHLSFHFQPAKIP
jgi:hypothetical protein